MKYINAKKVLPDELIRELQSYIQGGYIYIPTCDDNRQEWGEVSGYKAELQQRNKQIICEYRTGTSTEQLAQKYALSIYAIRKIIYQKPTEVQ